MKNTIRSTSIIPGLLLLSLFYTFLAACAPMERIPLDRCEEIRGVPGPADMALENRSAFGVDRMIVASQERRGRDPESEYLDQGGIKFIPLAGTNRHQVLDFEFSGRDEYPFHPEALDLAQVGGGRYLFVLNHARRTQHAVEVFRVDRTTLVFMGRFRHRFIEYPSDIVGLGLDEFYVINRRASNSMEHFSKSMAFTGSGSLVYYSNQTYFRILDNLKSPTGMALSPDQTKLWITLAGSEQLLALERGSGSSVRELARISVAGTPINPGFNGSSNLFLATIPSAYDWSSHADDAAEKAPSRILQVDTLQGRTAVAYQNPGEEISGATIAVANGNRIYLGQKYDSFVLACAAP